METKYLVLICILVFFIGSIFGALVVHLDNAVIYKPAMDTLCEKVFGEGFVYKETGGIDKELLCELDQEAIQVYLVQQNETEDKQ